MGERDCVGTGDAVVVRVCVCVVVVVVVVVVVRRKKMFHGKVKIP